MLEEYHLIKHRRNGSTIYQCKHYTHYMKVGDKQAIESEVEMYQTIHQYGFPLPSLLEYTIEQDDICFMKEESLEGNLFADVFTSDFEKYGEIQKNHFDSFCLYQKNHLFFQKNTENKKLAHSGFRRFEDLYEENMIEKSLIDDCIKKIESIIKILPIVWNHGDHNPYNIFTDGLIDLEDSFDGPLGYDTITALTQNFRFPTEGGELNQQHRFTLEQISRYLMYCTNKNINFMDSDIFGTLFLMRGIFATVRTNIFPLLREFRYKKLEHLMKTYRKGGVDMREYFIENYNSPVIV